MKIGIYGYGRFGSFLAESIQHYFDIIVTDFNISNMEKKLDNVIYFDETNFFKEEFDIVIFANSINSFESVIKKINPEFFKNKLIVDVLSVKEFALEIFEKYCQMV